MRFAGVLVVVCFLSGALWAAVIPIGGEIQVNTYTTGNQWGASVAAGAGGSFVVVWQSYGQDGSGNGIFGRRFDSTGLPLGPEFLVNSHTSSYQEFPAIASDAAGGFVVVWQSWYQDGSNSGVFGRRFDSSGAPIGGDFQVNTYTSGYQERPSIASNADGDFVVTWNSLSQDGSSWGVFAQSFDRTGTPAGSEFRVNAYTTGMQADSSVTSDAGGDFVVVWTSQDQDGSSLGVFGRRFDSTGASLGSDFQVNVYTTGDQESASVASNGDGDFVVVWQTWDQDGSSWGVFGRRFNSNGVPLGPEFQVNTYTTYHQVSPSVASDGAGNFVTTWTSVDQDGSYAGVFGQRFDSAGAPAGTEFQVNTYTTSGQAAPSVATNASGDFMVAWESSDQDGSYLGVFAQPFLGRSPALTSPLDGGTLDCGDPRVVRPTFAWDDDGYDRFRVFIGWDPGFGKGLRLTSGDTLLRTTSWTPPRKKWRKACAQALASDPSNPTLYVTVLGVDRDLSKKDPLRKRFSPVVQVDVQY
ncbi:MAG TPA: hypothetical protein VNI57_13220 [Candidatus Saccharimonadales bacterium]|nr:hypothetical protein [Candidatus Saccharimonadales bacterium]